MEGHVENFHGNSWEFGMAFFENVSVPDLIFVLFVNWKIKTSVNSLCSKQILYLSRWVVKYNFHFLPPEVLALLNVHIIKNGMRRRITGSQTIGPVTT